MTAAFIEAIRSHGAQWPTPFYVFDLAGLHRRIDQVITAWRQRFPNVVLAYSFKSNPARAILRQMLACGLAAEVVSGRELEEALHLGFETVFYNGPVKKPGDLSRAIASGARVHVDSVQELTDLARLSEGLPAPPLVAFRLSTPLDGGGLSRFGMTPDEFDQALAILDTSGIPLAGVHLHAGSNCVGTKTFAGALDHNRALIRRAYERRVHTSRFWIDLGGGFPAGSVRSHGPLVGVERFVEAAAAFFERAARWI